MSSSTITELSGRWFEAYARFLAKEGGSDVALNDLYAQASRLAPRSTDEAMRLLGMTIVHLDLEGHHSVSVAACRSVLGFEMMSSEGLNYMLRQANKRLDGLLDLTRSRLPAGRRKRNRPSHLERTSRSSFVAPHAT